MYKVILIERYTPFSFFWPNLLKNKKIETLSVEQILREYRGFEGDLISFYSPDESINELNEVINQFLDLKNYGNCLMLCVISKQETIPLFLLNQFDKVGYDVGVCEKEKTIYSSIFNEIIFGNLPELIVQKCFLNDNLLFQEKSIAQKYVTLHNTLSAQGKGVEDYEEMIIYEIWEYKNNLK